MEVHGKVCVITGSAQGLGKAFAVKLLEAGAKVCLSDLRQENGEKTMAEMKERFGVGSVCFVKCDVTKEDEFKNLFDKAEEFFKVKCIDILVNNAGINTNFGWRKCMDVNIMAVMMGSEMAMDRMIKTGRSDHQIINTASMAGMAPGFGREMIGYSVSKHGVVALTRTMANDPRHKIQHKCICPAWADTEIVSSVNNDPVGSKDASIKEMGGLMTPEYVAEGFLRLVTQCGNGSAMAVLKGFPYLLVPDSSESLIKGMAIMAKLMERVLGVKVVTTRHHVAAFTLIMFLFAVIIAWLF